MDELSWLGERGLVAENLRRWAAGIPGDTVLDDLVPLEWADRSWQLATSEVNDGHRSTDLAAARAVHACGQGTPDYDLIPLLRRKVTGTVARGSLTVIHHSYSRGGAVLLEAEHCQN